MINLPPELVSVIHDTLIANYADGRSQAQGLTPALIKRFSKGAGRLSTAYTSDRGNLRRNYFNDPVLRSGYLLYFLPVNVLKAMRVLREIPADKITSGLVRILDVGSGQGTNMLAVMAHYAELLQKKMIDHAWLDFTLIDQNIPALKDAKNLHSAYAARLSEKFPNFKSQLATKHDDFCRTDPSRFLRGLRYHLIGLSHIVNELPSMTLREQMVHTLIATHLVRDKGMLFIIEPATQKASRDVQGIRDFLLRADEAIHVYSPCTHQNRCPLNTFNQRDWCHFYLPWKRPPFIAAVDRAIGNKKDWLGFSYLLLGLNEDGKKEETSSHQWRVISNLLLSKGKKEVILCGRKGRYRIVQLNRQQSQNFPLTLLQRGDRLDFAVECTGPWQADGRIQLTLKDKPQVIDKI